MEIFIIHSTPTEAIIISGDYLRVYYPNPNNSYLEVKWTTVFSSITELKFILAGMTHIFPGKKTLSLGRTPGTINFTFVDAQDHKYEGLPIRVLTINDQYLVLNYETGGIVKWTSPIRYDDKLKRLIDGNFYIPVHNDLFKIKIPLTRIIDDHLVEFGFSPKIPNHVLLKTPNSSIPTAISEETAFILVAAEESRLRDLFKITFG